MSTYDVLKPRDFLNGVLPPDILQSFQPIFFCHNSGRIKEFL